MPPTEKIFNSMITTSKHFGYFFAERYMSILAGNTVFRVRKRYLRDRHHFRLKTYSYDLFFGELLMYIIMLLLLVFFCREAADFMMTFLAAKRPIFLNLKITLVGTLILLKISLAKFGRGFRQNARSNNMMMYTCTVLITQFPRLKNQNAYSR